VHDGPVLQLDGDSFVVQLHQEPAQIRENKKEEGGKEEEQECQIRGKNVRERRRKRRNKGQGRYLTSLMAMEDEEAGRGTRGRGIQNEESFWCS
jgi:hypothetical protein